MKPAVKAALLSALVFPGLGHIYLKRYGRGIVLVLLVLSGFGYAVGTATMSALDNLRKMQRMGPVDMSALPDLAASSAASSSSSPFSDVILVLVVCCWLFSIIDSYRMGKKPNSPGATPGNREEASTRR
jgi:hypothetical protein